MKEMSVFWVAEQQKAIERNTWLRKTDFSLVSKYYLKSVFSGKNKINTAARKIKVQIAGTPKSLTQPIPFRIPRLWEIASFV